MRKNTYAVFGLGRYGIAVARELVANGKEVLAIDANQKIVNDAAAYLPVCKCADVTDAEVIERLGIGNIDTVIVCMASNLEASVMAITLCNERTMPSPPLQLCQGYVFCTRSSSSRRWRDVRTWPHGQKVMSVLTI